jgi:hypothetical protein
LGILASPRGFELISFLKVEGPGDASVRLVGQALARDPVEWLSLKLSVSAGAGFGVPEILSLSEPSPLGCHILSA